jgi:type I restriction enzyme S subunit
MNRTLESMARAVFRQWFVDGEEVGDWEVGKLGEMCEFAYGKGLKKDDRQEGSIPVYGSNGQIGSHDEYLVKGPGIVVGRKGNPGIVTWTQTDFFPIDTTFYVIPKNSTTSLYWLYYALISLNLPDLGADSAVPGLNRNIAYMSDVNYPPHDLMNKFDDFVVPLFDKIYANEKESRTLARLRDSLLPKLMRGEVRVKS